MLLPVGEHSTLSANVTVELTSLFDATTSGITVTDATETTITANQPLAALKSSATRTDLADRVLIRGEDGSISVTLSAMQVNGMAKRTLTPLHTALSCCRSEHSLQT